MLIIYVLEKNNIPFYIGKCNNINVRYCQHKKKYGDDTIIKILELVEEDNWKDKEKYYISLYKSNGFKLENKNGGGGGPTKLNKKSRLKISKNKLGNLYKLDKLPKGKIEELYNKHTIQEISDLLNLAFTTVKRYLVNNEIYEKCKNKPPISKETKIKFANRKHRKGRSVIQFDKNKNKINEFPTLKDACISIGKIDREGDITSVCRGKQKTAFGFIWRYKD